MKSYRDFNNIKEETENPLQAIDQKIDKIFDDLKLRIRNFTTSRSSWYDKLRNWWSSFRTESLFDDRLTLSEYSAINGVVGELENALSEATGQDIKSLETIIDQYRDLMKKTVKELMPVKPTETPEPEPTEVKPPVFDTSKLSAASMSPKPGVVPPEPKVDPEEIKPTDPFFLKNNFFKKPEVPQPSLPKTPAEEEAERRAKELEAEELKKKELEAVAAEELKKKEAKEAAKIGTTVKRGGRRKKEPTNPVPSSEPTPPVPAPVAPPEPAQNPPEKDSPEDELVRLGRKILIAKIQANVKNPTEKDLEMAASVDKDFDIKSLSTNEREKCIKRAKEYLQKQSNKSLEEPPKAEPMTPPVEPERQEPVKSSTDLPESKTDDEVKKMTRGEIKEYVTRFNPKAEDYLSKNIGKFWFKESNRATAIDVLKFIMKNPEVMKQNANESVQHKVNKFVNLLRRPHRPAILIHEAAKLPIREKIELYKKHLRS